MRVLWVCNIMLPVIAEALHREASNKEGWLSGLLSQIVDREDTDMTLAVAFPVPAGEEIPQSFVVRVQGEHPACVAEATSATEAASAPEGGGGYLVRCYGFYEDTVHPDRYQPELEEELRKITEDYDPDVIHCFGTEYPIRWRFAVPIRIRRGSFWGSRASAASVRKPISPISRSA